MIPRCRAYAGDGRTPIKIKRRIATFWERINAHRHTCASAGYGSQMVKPVMQQYQIKFNQIHWEPETFITISQPPGSLELGLERKRTWKVDDSLTKLETGFVQTIVPWPSFSYSNYCSKFAVVNSSSAPLRCKSSSSLLPILQPRNVFLKDPEAVPLKYNHQGE